MDASTRSPAPNAWHQWHYLLRDIEAFNNRRWWRWYRCWFNENIHIIIYYRIGRFFYLLLGQYFKILHSLAMPLLFVIRPWFKGADIDYKADIGPGLRISHPQLGIVITGYTIVGENLILAGGNCIGRRDSHGGRIVVIKNNVRLGIGAIIMGPVEVGNNVTIGAGAVVATDIPDNQTVVGIPARPIHTA